VITVIVLFVMLGRSVLTGYALDQLPTEDALEIEVTGHQWWWQVHYRDADPSQGITTANEIHIPVGRPVVLALASSDVVHSFWVPSLHGKRDLVPGHVNTLTLRADRPGVYRGQCAEFCGQAHALMALWVVAEPAAAFEAWRAAQRKTPPAPETPETKRGQQVFLGGPCVLCHTVAGTSAQSNAGPDLTHFASRKSLAAASLPNTRGHLAGWLLNAQSLKPGSTMPNIGLSADDLHALIAYLETLR
jgi:cytochrome c oxidase subunit II